jgi:squalene cyclase
LSARAKNDEVVVDAETEQVIAGALRWLTANQAPNGSWSAKGGRMRGEHPVAMTGYSLIALMAAGNLPEEGEYAKEVDAGMRFLLDSMQPDGEFRDVEGARYMYNHGVATIALSELYGQTQHPAMRPKLERAIRLILESQATQGEHSGGWRYQPRPGDADISITVLQVVALRSAKNAGFAVPQRTIDDAIAYVKRCQDPGSGGFSYQANRRDPGFARTAAAIYSLQVCGLYDDPMVAAGARYLTDNSNPNQQWWTYGCNYAGPAMYMIGGDTWRNWYDLQRAQYLKSVKRAGDQCWWEGEIGAVYCTAAYATILAMPWHYLPLYQR